jgi:putative membrane protein
MTYSDLPHVNAALNSICTLLLITGFIFIRRHQITAHRICMTAAFFTSVLFLASYLVYHYHQGSVRFTGQGPIRFIYFIILISHIILAAVILPLVGLTLKRAFRGEFFLHKNIARWTLPLWLYVSVTGVIVYLMLYQFY